MKGFCYYAKQISGTKLVQYVVWGHNWSQNKILGTKLVINPNFRHVGMHAWFAAAADTRYSVAVPIIGVQVWGQNLFVSGKYIAVS